MTAHFLLTVPLPQRERMAIMEAAISSSLSHPNIVQVRDLASFPPGVFRCARSPPCYFGWSLLSWVFISSLWMWECTHFFNPLLQTYTYSIKPILRQGGQSRAAEEAGESLSHDSLEGVPSLAESADISLLPLGVPSFSFSSSSSSGLSSFIAGFEVQIVQEYCDLSSLSFFMQRQRQQWLLQQRPGLGDAAAVAAANGWGLSYAAILETASDVANGMRQLHALNIVHSDCKVCTAGAWGSANVIRNYPFI